MSSSQRPSYDIASSSSSSEDDAQEAAHEVLTYSRSRPSAKTKASVGNDSRSQRLSQSLGKNSNESTKTCHAQRSSSSSMLSLVLVTCILLGSVMSGQCIGKIYLDIDIQDQVMIVASYIDAIITGFFSFSMVSFSCVSAAEVSSSSDDDDDN